MQKLNVEGVKKLFLPETFEVQELTRDRYSVKAEKYRTEQAIKAGFEILKGDDHTLTFDLDGKAALEIFKERIVFLINKNYCRLSDIEVSYSKSKNYHAVVKLDKDRPPITEAQRCCIQACLGSDWKRELLGIMSLLDHNEGQSKLFRPKPLELVEL